jgi:CIC family chloride channel protein
MTSVLIIFEMTRGYGLVLPLMIANMSAFALARHWRKTPVYEALLQQDGIGLGKTPEPVEEPAQ